MSEIRIKQKTFTIGVGFTILLLFYFATKNPKCPPSTEFHDIKTVSSHQQVSSSYKVDNAIEQSQPFTVYAITPTYARPVQKAELTRFVCVFLSRPLQVIFLTFDHFRLAQTFILVPFVHWIIVEDADFTSDLVRNVLKRTNLYKRSTLLYAKTPADFKLKRKDPSWIKPRGVEQRNTALAWVRKHVKYSPISRSAIYFMDDDNTYSIDLFEEIKKIEPGKVAVWPVGLVGGLSVEKPVLDIDNRVLGFNSVVSKF